VIARFLFVMVWMSALAACAGAVAEVPVKAMKSTTIRVMTFNIFHGATMKGDFDLDHIASVITNARADLVALQEVDVRTGRVGDRDLSLELARRTGLFPLFARAMEYDGGEYGIAVLSRFSIRSSTAIALPRTEDNEPRAALHVIVDLPDGQALGFVATHLDNASQEDRVAQAHAINDAFATGDLPMLLAGDFNATPDSEPLRIFKAHWTPVDGLDAPPTYPSNAPEVKIDYVCFRPANRWLVQSVEVKADPVASDHFPLVTELVLSRDTAPE